MNPSPETQSALTTGARSPQDFHKAEFFRLRQARDLIKYAALMSAAPALEKPAPERTDPIQEILFRRAGLRLVEHARDSSFVSRDS